MSGKDFDDVIHAPNRLQICACLDSMAEIEFHVLRDLLGVSDSVLSKRTWLSLTRDGRKAYHGHVRELKKIVGTIGPMNGVSGAQR